MAGVWLYLCFAWSLKQEMGIAHDSGRSSDSKSVDDDILLTSYLIKMSLLDSSTIYTAPQL